MEGAEQERMPESHRVDERRNLRGSYLMTWGALVYATLSVEADGR